MKKMFKNTLKLAAGVCTAVGLVAAGSVVASGAAARVIAEGIKGAKNAMEQTIKDIKAENEGKTVTIVEQSDITEADFVTDNKEQE